MYERFVQLLQENGITAYRVSKDTGVTQTTLSDWKTGRGNPKTATLKKIADYFGVSLDWLAGSSEQRNISNDLEQSDIFYNPKVQVVFRHLEQVPQEDRDQLIKNFENTIDLYLQAKGIKKEE